MKSNDLNDKIYKFILKERSFKFHLITTILTCGIWCFLYFSIKGSYKLSHNNMAVTDEKKHDNFNKIINNMDYGTVMAIKRDGDFRKSINHYLVQVTSHGDSCEQCKKWENKILIDDIFSNGKSDGNHELLSTAIKQGLFHNGCRHGLTTYYPELEGIENETEEEYQADMDYINKKINKLLK